MSTFLGLADERADYGRSRIVVLPVPFERTTSFGKGAAAGPGAILVASQQVELYDEELGREPCSQGIATLPEVGVDHADTARFLEDLEREVGRHLEAGKFVVVLGGEHTLTIAPARAARATFGDVGIVQFDAHADLRSEFEGTTLSHACVMRRLLDDGFPTAAVGLRSLSRPEARLIHQRRLPVLWGRELAGAEPANLARLLAALPERVYLTFDIDFFDPAEVPATGTPEPGGGRWYPTLGLLRALFEHKRVVAMDLVELAPVPGQHASDFLAARLVYKCLGYLQASER